MVKRIFTTQTVIRPIFVEKLDPFILENQSRLRLRKPSRQKSKVPHIYVGFFILITRIDLLRAGARSHELGELHELH